MSFLTSLTLSLNYGGRRLGRGLKATVILSKRSVDLTPISLVTTQTKQFLISREGSEKIKSEVTGHTLLTPQAFFFTFCNQYNVSLNKDFWSIYWYKCLCHHIRGRHIDISVNKKIQLYILIINKNNLIYFFNKLSIYKYKFWSELLFSQ